MDGFHTVIKLTTPATVRFIAGNMLHFDGLELKVLGDVPQEHLEIDVESKPLPDDMAYGANAHCRVVEVQAKLLLVQTYAYRIIGLRDRLAVYRLEECVIQDGVPSFLQVLPHTTVIDGYFSERKQTLEESVRNHAALVQTVISDFSANNPCILYDGPFMMDALMAGEKEVSERIYKRAQQESATREQCILGEQALNLLKE